MKSTITRIKRITISIYIIFMISCFLIVLVTEGAEVDLYIGLVGLAVVFIINLVIGCLFIQFFFWGIRKIIEKSGKTVDAKMSFGCYIVWFFGICFGLLKNKMRFLKDAFKQGSSE